MSPGLDGAQEARTLAVELRGGERLVVEEELSLLHPHALGQIELQRGKAELVL